MVTKPDSTLRDSMSRPSKPWLLPVTCAVLGVGWVLWLAHGQEAGVEVPAEPATSSQATLSPRADERSDKHVDGAPPDAWPADVHSARAPETPQSSRAVPLQLVFKTPSTAQVGDGFDVRVAIAARNPIGRLVVQVAYDPSYLKVRTVEEIDYADRVPGERAFSTQDSNDGNVELVLQRKRGEAALALPASIPLVQFEAIAAGATEVRIAGISATDATDRPLPWSAEGREAEIALN